MYANPYDQYKNQAVLTANPEQLLLMLFDGAIKFLNQAIIGIENNDYEQANNNFIRTQDILRELSATLNLDYEISNYLQNLYDFFLRQLMEANIKKDKEIAQTVLIWLRELRETWAQASIQAKRATG